LNKIIFNNGSEIEIVDGATISSITAEFDNFSELQELSDILLIPENLNEVKFSIDDDIIGTYTYMRLIAPLFTDTDVVNGKVHATFGLSRKSDEEVEIEKLKEIVKEQSDILQSQDSAILDLGEIISSMAG